MKLNRQNKVVLSMIGFLVVGTIVVSITHKQDVQITQGSFDSTAIHVGD